MKQLKTPWQYLTKQNWIIDAYNFRLDMNYNYSIADIFNLEFLPEKNCIADILN